MIVDTVTELDARRQLSEAVARLTTANRDPETMRHACERMDRMREELRKRIGIVEVAVDFVRDARDP